MNQKKKTNKIGNRNVKKNNFLGISSDKLPKSHTRRLRYGYEKETLREKLNLFKQLNKTTP